VNRNHVASLALMRAIEQLFDSPRDGLSLLMVRDGNDFEGPPEGRSRALRAQWEGYLVSMADELAELGPEHASRLRAEATGLLIAMRDLSILFPESEGGQQHH